MAAESGRDPVCQQESRGGTLVISPVGFPILSHKMEAVDFDSFKV